MLDTELTVLDLKKQMPRCLHQSWIPKLHS